jgi:hypothetical protein
MAMCDQLRAQELELTTELERVTHLRGVMAQEPGDAPHAQIVENLSDEIDRLTRSLDDCRRQLRQAGC